MATINQNLKKFLTYLESDKKRRAETARNYHLYLQRFIADNHLTSVNQIKESTISQWRNKLKQRGIKPSTQNYHLIALRQFIRYLAIRDNKLTLPIDLYRTEKITKAHLSAQTVSDLIEAPNHNPKDLPIIRKRDHALLILMATTGLKVSEVAKLRWSDLNLSKGLLKTKGRNLTLSERSKAALTDYQDQRYDKKNWVFISHDRAVKRRNLDQPITTRSIQRVVEKYAALINWPKKISAHSLRNYFADSLSRRYTDIDRLQKTLGYRSKLSAQKLLK